MCLSRLAKGARDTARSAQEQIATFTTGGFETRVVGRASDVLATLLGT
jgi:hypothetical protein